TWRARVVIGADGVEAMVGRWAGLDTRVPARDMESCAQYVVQGIDFDPDAIYLQFGEQIAPGGYAWLFPKGPGIANVGLGLVALKADGRNARQYLDAWIARRYPGGARTSPTLRSEEHTSELQSRGHLVCRLLLEKKKQRETH